MDTWCGLALLLERKDEEARERLRRAVEGICAGGRYLMLPTAAVYLAEAGWRAGDGEAADRAADLALESAGKLGSNHLLLQALADFPAVLSRRLDAEPSADSPWHTIGRALRASPRPPWPTPWRRLRPSRPMLPDVTDRTCGELPRIVAWLLLHT